MVTLELLLLAELDFVDFQRRKHLELLGTEWTLVEVAQFILGMFGFVVIHERRFPGERLITSAAGKKLVIKVSMAYVFDKSCFGFEALGTEHAGPFAVPGRLVWKTDLVL